MRVQEGRNVRRECQYRLHTVEPRARVGGAQGEYRSSSEWAGMQARTAERKVIAVVTVPQKL